MEKMPVVSVIITAWNRRATIERAIDSVLRQSIQDFEIVLVDDASTDDLESLVVEKGWPKLRYIRNAVNRGIGGAKNVGVEAAKGRYIAFLDSDDAWMPTKLERQVAALEKTRQQLSFTEIYIVRQGSDRRVRRAPRRVGNWFKSLLLGETFSLGSTLLATRECFHKVGLFDERIKRMQDRDWLIRYFGMFDDIVLVDEPLAVVINSGWPSSATVRNSLDRLLEANRDRVASHGETYLSWFRSSIAFEMAVVEFRNREYLESGRSFLRAVGTYPPYGAYMARRALSKLWNFDTA